MCVSVPGSAVKPEVDFGNRKQLREWSKWPAVPT